MGLRMATPNVYLSEYKGENIAVRYDDLVKNVTTDFGTQDVVRADIVLLTEKDDGSLVASFEGQGLVYQKAIATQIEGNRDWLIGELEQVDRPTKSAPDATMYQITNHNLTAEAVMAAFEAAGISL